MQEAIQLKHFFQSKKPMLLLLGKHGAQRTEILSQAITFTTPDQMVLRLKGKTTCKPDNLTSIFKKHWAVNIKPSDNRLNTQLDEILECLTRQKQSCVLLIDHANLLPISVLAALCHLSHKQENQFIAIRIILAGHESLASKINALYLKKFAFPPVINLSSQTLAQKNKAANSKSFWHKHRVKSLAIAGIFVCNLFLWKMQPYSFLKPTHHIAHSTRQHNHA